MMVRSFFLSGVLIALLMALTLPFAALAWEAVETFSCRKVEVLLPANPSQIESGAEVEFQMEGTHFPVYGETTGWVPKCFGRCCLGEEAANFEVKRFSGHDLLYLRPVEQMPSP